MSCSCFTALAQRPVLTHVCESLSSGALPAAAVLRGAGLGPMVCVCIQAAGRGKPPAGSLPVLPAYRRPPPACCARVSAAGGEHGLCACWLAGSVASSMAEGMVMSVYGFCTRQQF
jgi:hypothetical protein